MPERSPLRRHERARRRCGRRSRRSAEPGARAEPRQPEPAALPARRHRRVPRSGARWAATSRTSGSARPISTAISLAWRARPSVRRSASRLGRDPALRHVATGASRARPDRGRRPTERRRGSSWSQLRDATGNFVGGKTVTLAASVGQRDDHAGERRHHGATTAAVVFSVTNAIARDRDLHRDDATDAITCEPARRSLPGATPAAAPASPPCRRPSPPTASARATITVTLKDALNRPTPGKEIALSQGTGQSLITGPNPSVTDANGQIDVHCHQPGERDGHLHRRRRDRRRAAGAGQRAGHVQRRERRCVRASRSRRRRAQNGYVVTPCHHRLHDRDHSASAASTWWAAGARPSPAFRSDSVFVDNFRTGDVFRSAGGWGVSAAATDSRRSAPTLGAPSSARTAALYATRMATTATSPPGDPGDSTGHRQRRCGRRAEPPVPVRCWSSTR